MKHTQTKTKNMLLALAIMLAAPTLILCQTGYKNTKKGGAEQEVRKTISDLATALGKNDTAALDRIYADDYTFVGDTGTVMNKAERIASFKSGDVKYESVSIEVARMHIFGDTAVAITNITTKFAPGAKVSSGKFITTATFVKIKGRWQLVAAGNTRLAE
ncbi:MAG: nuclear transport factor 2 family protein [Pyrinomonadaceae bacterium]